MEIPPSRTLGVAFSDSDRVSHVAGAVVTADGVLDGLGFERCTVGGTDATDAVIDLAEALGREDVRHVACAGIAPAWFNLLDLHAIRAALDRPVYAVSYEASPGLEPALREAFDGDALDGRLETYRALPPRVRVDSADVIESDAAESDAAESDAAEGDSGKSGPPAGGPLFVRSVGIDAPDAAAAVRGSVREGFRRPEPLRIAAIAASAHREAIAGD
ncbi:DUF99 family protein [Halorubrum sp. DTA46]|uniref:endonuclease dU n=1 Tax=Halorubrum sp. DTA46 TaxID=3402162 RepID=UPI003AAD5543